MVCLMQVKGNLVYSAVVAYQHCIALTDACKLNLTNLPIWCVLLVGDGAGGLLAEE